MLKIIKNKPAITKLSKSIKLLLKDSPLKNHLVKIREELIRKISKKTIINFLQKRGRIVNLLINKLKFAFI